MRNSGFPRLKKKIGKSDFWVNFGSRNESIVRKKARKKSILHRKFICFGKIYQNRLRPASNLGSKRAKIRHCPWFLLLFGAPPPGENGPWQYQFRLRVASFLSPGAQTASDRRPFLAISHLGMNRSCGILAISHLGGTVDDDDDSSGYPPPPTPSRPGKKYVVRLGSSLR